ncbi:MAG: ABC transporter permease [Candidatus Pacebacteria bacterium]|nr:ABC transporter permease [Candidatus Paceibacterota bacterium]
MADTKNTRILRVHPAKGLVPLNMAELWEYRELLLFLLWRDIKGRYKQTAFGPLWILGGPLINMVLLSLIFGKLAKLPSEGIPYPLFAYSALLPFGLFSSSLTGTATSLLDNSGLISKVYFPRLITPLLPVLSAFVNFSASFLILLGMVFAYGFMPGVEILCLPLFLLLAAMTGLAVGLWWASWIVHFRDLRDVLQYIVKAWMYASPVVYSSSIIVDRFGPEWMPLYRLNPIVTVVDGVRWCLLGVGQGPDSMLVFSYIVVFLLLLGGAFAFCRAERTIVDIA